MPSLLVLVHAADDSELDRVDMLVERDFLCPHRYQYPLSSTCVCQDHGFVVRLGLCLAELGLEG